MSRLTKRPLDIPKGVAVNVLPDQIEITGTKKTVHMPLPEHVKVVTEEGKVKISVSFDEIKETKKSKLLKLKKELKILSGTVWALLKNSLVGASENFKIKLELVGVGYRAQAQGNKLNLTLGFSHPVVYLVPEGVSVETPSQTEIHLISVNKQLVGQVAAEIRSYRPPECYKGKGIKFSGQIIPLKETKKK